MSQSNEDTEIKLWEPVVLSLDGGGVRGLSALYILRRIMRRIQEIAKENNDDPVASAKAMLVPLARSNTDRKLPRRASLRAPARSGTQPVTSSRHFNLVHCAPFECGTELPLPCWYFDYMIGTSTGGLIAVMLGRLRMSIDDAIKQYWILSNYIFRPGRWLYPWNHLKLEESIKKVVIGFCGCHHHGACNGEEPLLQYDYLEDIPPYDKDRLNHTCKVALIAIKKKDQGDAVYMFRSYNHNPRFKHRETELNPAFLRVKTSPKIWEACRASAAAPLYFRKMVIDDQRYLDGGVGNNNPADLAWNEAKFMSTMEKPEEGNVKALVSLGTGTAPAKSRFGFRNLLRWSRRSITATTKPHEHVRELAHASNSQYWRFDVKPEDTNDNGLAGVKLSDCKRTKPWKQKNIPDRVRAKSPASSANDERSWYEDLQLEAMRGESKSKWRWSAYRPDKYAYVTFDKIYERTEHYCTFSENDDGTSVQDAIDECARLLYETARARWRTNPMRFRKFVSHPNPRHKDYLPRGLETVKEGEDKIANEDVARNPDDGGDDSGVEGVNL